MPIRRRGQPSHARCPPGFAANERRDQRVLDFHQGGPPGLLLTVSRQSLCQAAQQPVRNSTHIAERLGIPALNGVVSTTSRTTIDVSRHTISYVLDCQDASRPATHPLDPRRPRHFELTGNKLTLRTKDDNGTVLSVTVWQKNGV